MIIYSTLLLGCSDGKYADSSNWNISDELFSSQYFEYYSDGIEAIAENYQINGITSEMNPDGKGFCINYLDDNQLIQFSFYNTLSGYGNYHSYYYIFRTNIEDLFHYSDYSIYLAFINEVNEFVSFDFQGGVETFQELYMNYISHSGQTSFATHYDSVVGNLGYWIVCSDNYSDTEQRWYIEFHFHSLLKPMD